MSPAEAHAHDPLAILTLDPESSLPPFRQLHDAAVRAIGEGRLHPGQKLPTVRALAGHLGVATNTVASAYRALEEAGIVQGRGRAGTFVSLGENPVMASARKVALDAVAQLRGLGISADETEQILIEAARS